jgi:hypothetical protein
MLFLFSPARFPALFTWNQQISLNYNGSFQPGFILLTDVCMKRILRYCLLLFSLPYGLSAQTVISIKIDGTINPVTADFIHDGIEKATKEKAVCLLIHLNTPAALLKINKGDCQ